MTTIFDYLKWRGDILFSQVPFNSVDALIFSTLSYIAFDGIVPETPERWVTLRDAAAGFFAQQNLRSRIRVKQDLALLEAAADTERFGGTKLAFYRSLIDLDEEMQFAALTCFLDDGTAVLAYRGTDRTLVGWKEDFNMAFQESIPAQREAQRYICEFAAAGSVKMRLVGHSKGGNLAVYAAAKAGAAVQERILEVYNQDGPGFNRTILDDPGYQSMIPKIRTFVPQSSVIGMLLEHEEPYTVIKSRQVGLMQHDPYSWEVLGKDFIRMEEVTDKSRVLDHSLKSWLAGMSMEERNELVDTIYKLLTSGGASQAEDLIHPKNVQNYVKTLTADKKTRGVIDDAVKRLVQQIRIARWNGDDP